MNLESYLNDPVPNGDVLCHYTTSATAMEHILHDGKLKLAALRTSHDPLEFEDFEHSAHTWASGDQKVVMDMLDELTKRGVRENEIVKHHIKIACFCIDGSDLAEHPHHKACNRSRMWIQYANAHTGICLAFDRQILINEVSKQIGQENVIFSDRVDYKNSLKELAAAVSLSPADRVATELDRVRKHAKLFLFTKLKDFQNENEYRICFWKRNESSISEHELLRVGGAIVGILLGSSFPEAYIPLIRKKAKDMQIPVCQAFWLHGTPLWVDLEKRKALGI